MQGIKGKMVTAIQAALLLVGTWTVIVLMYAVFLMLGGE
jgi:hypothetical protein